MPANETSKELWNQHWQDSMYRKISCHEKPISALFSVIDVKGKKILEIGAGTGADSIFMAKTGAESYALDYSEEALALIESNAGEEEVKINLVKSDAASIPYPEGFFDAVFSLGLIEHFKDPSPILKEQCRILKTGGIILVDVPQKYHIYTLEKQSKIKRGNWYAGWETQYSAGELEKLVKNHGFKILKTYAWGFYPLFFSKIRYLANTKTGKRLLPRNIAVIYESFWKWVESLKISKYLLWNIGVIGRKI